MNIIRKFLKKKKKKKEIIILLIKKWKHLGINYKEKTLYLNLILPKILKSNLMKLYQNSKNEA